MTSLSTSEMLRESKLSAKRLYYWEKVGIVNPEKVRFGSREYRRYSWEDLQRLRRIRRLVSCGYSLRGAARRISNGVWDAR